MGPAPKLLPAALGFRVKSGWAMSVLLSGSASSPRLLLCRSVLLSDPKEPRSKQPYHAALDLPASEGTKILGKLCKIVADAAERSVSDLLQQASELQYTVRRAALVVGSLVDPASLGNDHMRAHGLEGQLFRTALEDAMRKQSIRCHVLVEKTAYETAAQALGKSPAETRRAIAALKDSHNGSWRAEEKLATLAAWMSLAARA